jgi:hypothetical protein
MSYRSDKKCQAKCVVQCPAVTPTDDVDYCGEHTDPATRAPTRDAFEVSVIEQLSELHEAVKALRAVVAWGGAAQASTMPACDCVQVHSGKGERLCPVHGMRIPPWPPGPNE